VVNTTITSLVTLSRSQRRPTFGSIFLLNNVSYLRTHLLTNGPDALLSSQGKELLNSNFRTAKAKYMDANLSPLLAALGEDKDKSKSSVKEKFTRFFDLLDELVERHAIAEVLPDESEEDERERVCQEVVPLVVSLFQGYVQKNPGKDFSRSKSSALPPQSNVDHRRSYSQTRRNVSSYTFLCSLARLDLFS
jgi:exocyst complex protein 7